MKELIKRGKCTIGEHEVDVKKATPKAEGANWRPGGGGGYGKTTKMSKLYQDFRGYINIDRLNCSSLAETGGNIGAFMTIRSYRNVSNFDTLVVILAVH